MQNGRLDKIYSVIINSVGGSFLLNKDDLSSNIKSVDFNSLIEVATYHKVFPPVYKYLAHTFNDVPHHIKTQFEYHIYRNLYLTKELIKIVELLEKNNIRVIPYKGPTLSLYLFGDVVSRQFVDLDILVSPKDTRKSIKILLTQGFKPFYKITKKQETLLFKSGIEYVLTKSGEFPYTLEMHWRIDFDDKDFPLDFETLYNRCKPLNIYGKTLPHLCSEDLFLILCLHGGKHLYEISRLSWIYDLATFLYKYSGEINWENLAPYILKNKKIFFPILYFAKELFDAPVPENIYKSIKGNKSIMRIISIMEKRLFILDINRPLNKLETIFLKFLGKESLLKKFEFLASKIITPNNSDWELIYLPDYLYFLYYIIRPFNKAYNYTKISFDFIKRKIK